VLDIKVQQMQLIECMYRYVLPLQVHLPVQLVLKCNPVK